MTRLDIADCLRRGEAVQLPHELPPLDAHERTRLIEYLSHAYARESHTWAYSPPPFDPVAALYGLELFIGASYLWAGPTHGVPESLPVYTDAVTPGGVLSADLNLRYVAKLRARIRATDSDASEGAAIDERLAVWPYSLMLYEEPPAEAIAIELTDACARTCFVDRLIEQRLLRLGLSPKLRSYVHAAVGTLGLWPAFELAAAKQAQPAA